MKRHLPGLVVFVLIVSISIAAFALIKSISDSFDIQSVPPVAETPPTTRIFTEEDYVFRLVQYNYETGRLTGTIEVDRAALDGRSKVDIPLRIDSSESDAGTFHFDTVAKILSGSGAKAFIVFDLIVPGNVVLRKDQNYYISFRMDSHDDVTDGTSSGFGKSSPIVFVHPRPTMKPGSGPGPVILQ